MGGGPEETKVFGRCHYVFLGVWGFRIAAWKVESELGLRVGWLTELELLQELRGFRLRPSSFFRQITQVQKGVSSHGRAPARKRVHCGRVLMSIIHTQALLSKTGVANSK